MYYSLDTLIYPVGSACKLRVRPVFPVSLDGGRQYALRVIPWAGLKLYALSKRGVSVSEEVIAQFDRALIPSVEDGALTADITFPQEDRYAVRVLIDGAEVESLDVYALDADMYPMTPYKGDDHMHSIFSDGAVSPELMAAECRARGLDFVTPTDHLKYEPSLRVKELIDPLGLDFMILPGEEVHSPGNPIHILNMGGEASVNDWFREHPDEYDREVAGELAKINVPMTADNKYAAAASVVMLRKIRENDGVAVLCHPYWMIPDHLNEQEDVTDYLFERRAFDAFELVAFRGSEAGTRDEASTQMQIAYDRAYPDIPVLGNSDAHRVPMLRNFTIVFAESLTPEAIKRAVREGRCVAGYDNKLFGPMRLVKYAYFAMERVFPEHDAKCKTQGDALRRYLCGAQEKPLPDAAETMYARLRA